jgi:hypothetical protein
MDSGSAVHPFNLTPEAIFIAALYAVFAVWVAIEAGLL